jgi:hypothetical protein
MCSEREERMEFLCGMCGFDGIDRTLDREGKRGEKSFPAHI